MRLIHLLIPAFVVLSSQHAIAQANYPDRPIKMIVPLAAASAVDVAELGFAVRGSSAAELRAMTRDQLAKYERVIKEMGIAKE